MAVQPQLVAAIGASAGGLEALDLLLRGTPADTGIAFVVITHLAPGHASSLPEILARSTSMPVLAAEDRAPLKPDHVFVCPPDKILTVENGMLRLRETASRQRRPIDVCLASVAQDHGESAIGILLSGGGTDGTLGLKAIKEAGGLTIAQGSNGSAPQHAGMPESAIGAGVVDFVIPAEGTGAKLADFAREARGHGRGKVELDGELYREICRILLSQVGHDFSGYKEKTFGRRVARRMQMIDIDMLSAYLERLRTDPDEVGMLFRDLLIGVTTFFRDPEAFAALETMIIPELFAGKGATDPVRIWVPGCATGEEVYTLAMVVREHAEKIKSPPRIQIFATDIDERALAVARAGRYPAAMLDGVSPERVRRHFTGDDVAKTLRKELRDLCIFSSHSVLRDPPFSRMDLISCRNLLIYLGSAFQAMVVPVFHFALAPRGYLFLGSSETVNQHGELFAAIDKKHRIFQRRDAPTAAIRLPQFSPAGRDPRQAAGRRLGIPPADLRRDIEAHVLERFSPAHVVVNREGEVLHYSARTGKYLEPASGLPSRDLLSMTRRDLRIELRAALREAQGTRRAVTRSGVQVILDDRMQLVDITIDPLPGHDGDPLFLVIFRDASPPAPADGRVNGVLSGDGVEQLELELHETRDRLQATIEEYETAVEELKSANEELQSTNEELQSSNEEHETAREELQSVNEELHTVNAELNAKVEELDRAHADLRNVFDATRVATIFLDRDLIIRTFTPSAREIFSLISTDRGRPLTDISSKLGDLVGLDRELHSVFESGEVVERRVRRAEDATTFLMRVLPYHGGRDAIEGVLVTFVDVSTVVQTEAHLRTLVEELNHRVRNMLTVVGAVATQTLIRTPDPARFAEAFLGRIQSMAQAYGLVSRQKWGDVALHDILMVDLRDYAEENAGRVELSGPPVSFKPNAAIALNLVLHELATNASKHGALSTPLGRLLVEWAVRPNGDGRELSLDWREIDGPAVDFSGHRGFGTELIERQLRTPLNAAAAFEHAPSGLVVRITIPENPRIFTLPATDGAR